MEAIRPVVEQKNRGVKRIFDKARKTVSMLADADQLVSFDSFMVSSQRVNAIMLAVRAEKPNGQVNFGDLDRNGIGYVSAKYRNTNKGSEMNDTFIPNIDLKYFQAKTERMYGIETNPVADADGNPSMFDYIIIPVGDVTLGKGEELEISFNSLMVHSSDAQNIVVSVSLIETGESSIDEYLFKIEKSSSKQSQAVNCYDVDIQVTSDYVSTKAKFNDSITITKNGATDTFFIDSARIIGLAEDRVEASLVSQDIINVAKFSTPTTCSIDVDIENASSFVQTITSSLVPIPEAIKEG